MTSMTFKHGNASLKLSRQDRTRAAISNLWSATPGHGDAKQLLQKVVDYADEHLLDLVLIAQQYGPSRQEDLNNTQLESFYMRFGFKKTDAAKPAFMIRQKTSLRNLLEG